MYIINCNASDLSFGIADGDTTVMNIVTDDVKVEVLFSREQVEKTINLLRAIFPTTIEPSVSSDLFNWFVPPSSNNVMDCGNEATMNIKDVKL